MGRLPFSKNFSEVIVGWWKERRTKGGSVTMTNQFLATPATVDDLLVGPRPLHTSTLTPLLPLSSLARLYSTLGVAIKFIEFRSSTSPLLAVYRLVSCSRSPVFYRTFARCIITNYLWLVLHKTRCTHSWTESCSITRNMDRYWSVSILRSVSPVWRLSTTTAFPDTRSSPRSRYLVNKYKERREQDVYALWTRH